MRQVILGPEQREKHLAPHEVPSRRAGKKHQQGESLLLYIEESLAARAVLHERDGTERSKKRHDASGVGPGRFTDSKRLAHGGSLSISTGEQGTSGVALALPWSMGTLAEQEES